MASDKNNLAAYGYQPETGFYKGQPVMYVNQIGDMYPATYYDTTNEGHVVKYVVKGLTGTALSLPTKEVYPMTTEGVQAAQESAIELSIIEAKDNLAGGHEVETNTYLIQQFELLKTTAA